MWVWLTTFLFHFVVEEKYHTLFRKGELNLTKLLKKEIDGAAAGGQTPIESNSPSPGVCIALNINPQSLFTICLTYE